MLLEIQNIEKSFGDNHVLQGISFAAEGGKAIGLLGRNGAGKTTAIRIIMGVFPADGGSVLWNGAPIQRQKVRLGYLPEEHGLYPRLIVRDQLLYLAELRGMRRRDAKASVEKWFKRLDIQQYLPKKLDTLSKGNQQKVQLATALITEPDCVILDEPFSGLDPVNASLLKDVVKELIALGRTVLFSSHQMSYVEEFCDSIAILHHGSIVASGSIDSIKRSYDRSRMLLKTPQTEEAARLLQAQTDLVETITPTPGGLHVKLRQAEQKPTFMQLAAASGLDIDTLAVYEPTLTDIFVQYTGDATDEKAGAAQ